jgi:hypothetical protein
MRHINRHLSVFLGLQVLVFSAYHRLLSLDIWNPVDLEILQDAFKLSHDTSALYQHIGSLFSQPLLQLFFVGEYRMFGLDPTGYLTVNIILHGLNAFMVYLLVNMLFHRTRMALPSAVLFALSVGHYGKVLLSISGQEPLLLGFLYLLGLSSLIRADFKHGGRLSSPWFLFGLLLFGLAGLTRPALFSILLCLVSYKFFFYKERGGRAVFPPSMILLIIVGVLFAIFQQLWGFRHQLIQFSPNETLFTSVWQITKTLFRYLNLMVFPLQVSTMLTSSNPLVQFAYEWRVPIRSAVSLAIVSFSFFGIVFGNRSLRFFIAWTFITVLPFSLTHGTNDWLNLQYLYLAAVGFCVILAAGATGCQGLLSAHRYKRWLPWVGPMLFVVMTLSLNHQLTSKSQVTADQPDIRTMHSLLVYQVEHGPLSQQNPPE